MQKCIQQNRVLSFLLPKTRVNETFIWSNWKVQIVEPSITTAAQSFEVFIMRKITNTIVFNISFDNHLKAADRK